jgi:hypothetical protein
MKKNVVILSTALLLGVASIFTSCKKDDVTNPVVTINGSDNVTVSLNSTYSDAGATADDDRDGDLSASVTSDAATAVNTNKTGTYTVTYSATDEAGNTGTATRTVTVKNDAEAMAGKYNGNETDINGPYTYSGNTDATKTVTLTVSETKNNRLSMTRLGDFANNVVNIDVTGTTIDLPTQTVSNIGSGTGCDVASHTFSGTGTKTSTGFTLTYTDQKLSPCTGTRTNVQATFTKQ